MARTKLSTPFQCSLTGRGIRPRTLNEVVELVFKKAIFDPSGCWMSRNTNNGLKGYKMVYYNRGWILCHRLFWELHYGYPVPEGMIILHKCDNPACFNPLHLRIGTNMDNMRDMISKGRERHPNGEELAKKLTAKDVIALREEYARGGVTLKTLGKKYGVSKTHARQIVRFKKWKHVQ